MEILLVFFLGPHLQVRPEPTLSKGLSLRLRGEAQHRPFLLLYLIELGHYLIGAGSQHAIA